MGSQDKTIEWREFTAKLFAGALIAFSGLLSIGFLIVCIIYFPPRGVSPGLESLGLYGDFFGGIVGAIVSIASLGVTIYLAVVLQRFNRENARYTIEAQRRIAIMQMKLQELAKLKSQSDMDIDELWRGKIEDIDRACKSLDRSFSRIKTLFPELEKRAHFFEFGFVSFSAQRVLYLNQEYGKEQGASARQVVLDSITGDTVDEIKAAEDWYLKLTRKLSKWAAE